MDMNPQTRRNILIGAAVLVVLVVAVVIWWFVSQKTEPVTNTINTNTAVPNTNLVIINTVTNQAANTNAADPDQVALIRLANLFAERYGSYSSEAGFQNITNLKPYMTKKMQTVSDGYITTQRAASSVKAFYSTTTSALSTSVTSLAQVKASISVSTQRRETGENINGANTYYQVLLLDFVKEGETWLVDNAVWQPKGSL